jgi:hypothetical protein
MHETCLCQSNIDFSALRGDHYYIGAMTPAKKRELRGCVTTFWSASHFVLYTALGFCAPDLFWQTFAIGVIFELYEKITFSCNDALDIAYNSTGFLFGRAINHAIK